MGWVDLGGGGFQTKNPSVGGGGGYGYFSGARHCSKTRGSLGPKRYRADFSALYI